MAKKNFIIISGGPGIYFDCDKRHDKAWKSYVTPVLNLGIGKAFPFDNNKNENLIWFVYKPAYERRWEFDKVRFNSKGSSHVETITRWASQIGATLVWFKDANDFWKQVKTYKKISRVWYFGHARDDLWMKVVHKGEEKYSNMYALVEYARGKNLKDPVTDCEPYRPADYITSGSISLNTKDVDIANIPTLKKYNRNKCSFFIGCNTAQFAQKWAKVFKVYAAGFALTIDFSKVNDGSSKDILKGLCSSDIDIYDPTGKKATDKESF